ncbi:MAG: cupin domain-containing protein [Sedimentisphaerales bacterium]|nr:cupin domain-containing protein [Sedimentisphaerales bacterium]
MLIKKIDDVAAVPVEMEGAKDVKIRVLFGPKDGSPTFAMRIFELDKSGHTPFHRHPFEHQVMVLQGDIGLVSEDGQIPIKPGDVVMVMPGEKHQFRNLSDKGPAKIMCMIPVEYQK